MNTYFKIAWRSLMKNKMSTFINVFGLTIGLTCCILITLYIRHELSYDRHHPDGERLVQLEAEFKSVNGPKKMATAAAPIAAAMKMDLPEIEETTRLVSLFQDDKTLIQYQKNSGEEQSFYETKGYLTDPPFFRMFRYNFLEGNPSTALDKPNTIVICEDMARKIFGNGPAINKTLTINSNTNGNTTVAVTGVFRNPDRPSHIEGRFFMSMQGGGIDEFIRSTGNNMINNNMFYTYFKLKPGTDFKKLENKFAAFTDKHMGDALRSAGISRKFFVLPVESIHLNQEVPQNVTRSGNKTYLFIFGSIAVFILLIACINFMNLSTANSSRRATEVGIRKVLGAQKGTLRQQFLSESMLIAFIAFLFSCLLAFLLLPLFSSISGKTLRFLNDSGDLGLFAGFVVLTLLTGLVAGSYPAFYLSSFAPVRVLKGTLLNRFGAATLRKTLVVFQFIISVTLIVASVVISDQMSFLQTKDPGFARDHQLIIPLRNNTSRQLYATLKNEIKQNRQVQDVAGAQCYPGIFNAGDNRWYKEGQTMEDARITKRNAVDADFFKTLNIRLLAGRLFSKQTAGDTSGYLVMNEQAIKELGFSSPEKAVGQKVFTEYQGQRYSREILGVVKDFNHEGLQNKIQPYSFVQEQGDFQYLIVHGQPGSIDKLRRDVQAIWEAKIPGQPFDYSFLDSDFQKNYETDSRLFAVIRYFTLIAILISCMGLFGLASFSAEQRTKEVGIRKVLGANVTEIVGLLSADFLKLITVAVLIASPIAWLIMNKWLQEFAYHVNIGWDVFALTLVISIVIAFLTISLKALKAALANPVKSLRTE